MADEPTRSGWLPPRAPGGRPPPQFAPAPPEPERAATGEAPPIAPPGPWRAPEPGGASRTFGGRRRETNGLAATGVVLGVIGLALLVLTLGLGFVVTLPCSIAAWICASQARTRISLGETTAGRGQAQAAYVLGLVGVVLGVMAAVGWIAAIAAGVDLQELRESLERRTDPGALVGTARALLGR